MIDTSKSKSDEQQKAEIFIGDRVEEYLACLLKRNERVFLLMEYILYRIYIRKRIELWVRYLRISVLLR